MTEFISLYDYLGKAAGNELGKQVADYALACLVPHDVRHIITASYKGPVMLYPKSFLELYFKAYYA